MGEASGTGLVDEGGELAARGESGYADKRDFVAERCFDLCDRRALCSTRRSPRRPEPQHKIGIGQLGQVEHFTVDRYGLGVEDIGRQYRAR